MGRKNKNGKKKHTGFKNVMITLGCTVFAVAYAAAIVFAVETYTGDGTQARHVPVWLDKVEIHVDGETSLADNGAGNTLEAGTVESESAEAKSDKTPESSEQEPRFEEEETTETQTESDTKTKSSKKDKEDTEESKAQEESVTEEETDAEESEEATETETEESEEATETEETETRQDKKDAEKRDKDSEPVVIREVQTVETEDVMLTNVTAIVKAAMPCVVSVRNEYTTYDYWYDEMVDDEANASGIIVAQDEDELVIITNYHVIEDCNSLYVTFVDDEEVEAYVKGVSLKDDIALVSVFLDEIPEETVDEIAIAVLGDSNKLEVGEPAIAIGNALGYGQSVTTGIISAFSDDFFTEEDYEGYGKYNMYDDDGEDHGYLIQTDAAINPGNSGGALLNAKGEVIGICEGKLADYVIEGMGYAIPISVVKPVIDDLMDEEVRKKVPADEKGFLGIAGTDVSDEAMERYDMPEGVYVSSVLEDTAAEDAGILKGDIIVSIDGEQVTHMTQIQDMLDYYAAGTEVEVTAMRQVDGEYIEKTFDIVLGYRQD